MFSWFRRPLRPPPRSKDNPGLGHTVKAAFANSERSWEETDNLVDSLAAALRKRGHEVTAREDYIELDGFTLLPQMVRVNPRDAGGMLTVTTIQVAHADLVPAGVFEYQHSTGNDICESFASGFDQWAQVDLPVFLDALRAEAESSMYMVMSPGREGTSLLEHDRRVVMGPTAHYVTRKDGEDEEHPFCPCCLFTNSADAYRDLLKGGAFHAIRLFASRDAEGKTEADCRVNGLEWPAGAEKLIQYVARWPQRGFEFRKQYVAIQPLSPQLREAMEQKKAASRAGEAHSRG